MNDATRFMCALFTQRPAQADAIIVLAGQDSRARLDTGLALFKRGAAPTLVLSGGRSEPPEIPGADDLAPLALGEGVAPSALVVEGDSANTRGQAMNCVAMAVERHWSRVLLVASAYHLPRAFLTFIEDMSDMGHDMLDDDGVPVLPTTRIRLLPVPAPVEPLWHQCPPGCDRTRAELLLVESVKITEYQQCGHCASYSDGLAYLKQWEGK